MSNKLIDTTCSYCGVGCGIKADVNHETREVKIIGLDNHPANYGRLCSKGSALGETVSLDERMLEPQINNQVVTWDTALDAVAHGFQEVIDKHGPDAVAFYLSGQLLTEDYYVANKLMKGFIGSANIDTNSRLCMSSSVIGHKRAFGTDTVPGCYEDFEEAELIVLVGSNTAWCHPVLFQRIQAYKKTNPALKVVVIDPRRTQTCDIADLHLPVSLGTDNWLFNGLLAHLSDNNNLDKTYIEQHCQGFNESLTAAKKSSPSLAVTAQHCGISEDDLALFYQWFGQTQKTVTLYSQGVNQSSSGTDKVNAIINCHLATGRIGKPGMGPFSMTGQPNAMGGREVGGLANTLASHLDFSAENIDRLNRYWCTDNVAQQAGLTAVDLFDAIDEGKIKAVWIAATNPAVSMPNADKVVEALKKCPLVVVSDCIEHTDTTRLAHIKLPAIGWSEKDGTVTNSERRISRQRALLPPAANAKPDWWIFSRVAERMGFSQAFNFRSAYDVFKEHATLSGFENDNTGRRRDFDISGLATLSQQDYDELNPIQWPVNNHYPKGLKRFFSQGDFFTTSRKAQFIPITARLPTHQTSHQYPLHLNTGRIRDQWHTMTRTGLATQLNQHINEPFIELHPSDAKIKGLKDKQLVFIKSQWGSALARLTITSTIKPSECFVPMHWTKELSQHSRIGAVVNPVVDPISFQPESKHTPVDITPFQAEWQGLLLSRNKLTWPKTEYLVESKGKQHSLYFLASETTLTDSTEQLEKWLKINPTWEFLSYEDTSLGHYRLAALDNKGQLQAVALISTADQLPDPNWLGMQFDKPSLDTRSRNALLSGQAPAGEDIGKIICACFSIGEKTIDKAIKEKKLNSIEAIGRCTKAGTNCGSCVPEIKQRLNKV